jgi:hypothetical protein
VFDGYKYIKKPSQGEERAPNRATRYPTNRPFKALRPDIRENGIWGYSVWISGTVFGQKIVFPCRISNKSAFYDGLCGYPVWTPAGGRSAGQAFPSLPSPSAKKSKKTQKIFAE